jgi:hypothetical protein
VREPAVVIVAGTSERYAKLDRDVAERELLKADELECLSLLLGETRESGADHPSALVARQPPPFG